MNTRCVLVSRKCSGAMVGASQSRDMGGNESGSFSQLRIFPIRVIDNEVAGERIESISKQRIPPVPAFTLVGHTDTNYYDTILFPHQTSGGAQNETSSPPSIAAFI